MPTAKTIPNSADVEDLEDFLKLVPPKIPILLENVTLAFVKNIPEDAKHNCRDETGAVFPIHSDYIAQRKHLMRFVHERLDQIARLEYNLWLNGRLPFITPREIQVWRLRQYVEHIWAFQLPDDDDLAMIFNTTKLRAATLSADFVARFRKALLFPIALRRLYRILRCKDPVYTVVDKDIEYKQAYGWTFRVPSSRYIQDTNALIEEYRLKVGGFLRDAAMFFAEDNIMWVSEKVVQLANDDEIKTELLKLYKIPDKSGYEG